MAEELQGANTVKKLKPVVYTSSTLKKGPGSTARQIFLLKALQITQDPKKLKQMIGVKTVAQVFQTLDKMSMRKEYHEALAENGVSFDFLVKGFKNIAMSGEKDSDRLKALQVLLKSVGMDEYKEDHGSASGSWEEELLKKLEQQNNADVDEIYGGTESPKLPASNQIPIYDVEVPEIPESEKEKMKEEDDLTSSIYG